MMPKRISLEMAIFNIKKRKDELIYSDVLFTYSILNNP